MVWERPYGNKELERGRRGWGTLPPSSPFTYVVAVVIPPRVVRPLDAANERLPDRVLEAELQHITRENLDAGSVDFGATPDTLGHELQIGGETHQTLAYLQRLGTESRNRPQPEERTTDDGVYAHVEPVVVHDADLYSVRSHGILDDWYRGIARNG